MSDPTPWFRGGQQAALPPHVVSNTTEINNTAYDNLDSLIIQHHKSTQQEAVATGTKNFGQGIQRSRVLLNEKKNKFLSR
jgi:hypothetical protein